MNPMMETKIHRMLLICMLVVLAGCQQVSPALQATPEPVTYIEPTPASGVLVELLAPVSKLGVGESADISVQLHRVENLVGAEVHIQFDAGQLQVEDAEPGTEGVEIKHGGLLQPEFIAANLSDNEIGNIDYAISQMPPFAPVQDSGVLCIVNVKAVASGKTRITLASVILADDKGNQIEAAILNASLDIEIK